MTSLNQSQKTDIINQEQNSDIVLQTFASSAVSKCDSSCTVPMLLFAEIKNFWYHDLHVSDTIHCDYMFQFSG